MKSTINVQSKDNAYHFVHGTTVNKVVSVGFAKVFFNVMQAQQYLDQLRGDVARWWLRSTTEDVDRDAEAVLAPFSAPAMELRMRQHLHDHGGIPSVVTPQHELPQSGATIMDALIVANRYRWGLHHAAAAQPSTSLWTPTWEECLAAGCRRLPQSKLLLPSDDLVTAHLLTEVHNWFPDELRVRPTDTIDTLVDRIARCAWLDDMGQPAFLKKRGRAARLNATSSSQPRRATFSVQVSPEFIAKVGGIDERVIKLNRYYAYKHARAMPATLFDLSTAVWKASYPHLAEVSRICPFTHCQVLLYYECFRSRINQHRDNSNVLLFNAFVKQLESGETSTKDWDARVTQSGQRARSNVVVFTLGDAPMKMVLRYPHKDNLCEDRSNYETHPTLHITLAAGTIWVWDFMDDIFFTHEAFFEFADDQCVRVGESGMRQAYVFRHVDQLGTFHSAPERNFALVPDEDALRERERNKRKRTARARASLMHA